MSYLELKNIVKDFPGVRALNDVTLSLEKGKILALCGENGAGKSTLMKVLSGVYPHGEYEGQIFIDGEECKFSGTADAEEKGIAIIYQELNLIRELTVAENIIIGHEKEKIIDWGRTYKQISDLFKYYDFNIDPSAKILTLKLGEMQLVEIAKALSRNAKILVLDEPTSALSDKEVDKLFSIMRRLKNDGVTMIYISHKLEELKRVCDEIAVLRDGKSVMAPISIQNMSKDRIIKAMVGREITDLYPYLDNPASRPLLEVENWQVRHPLLPGEFLVVDISFSVRAGEIFGIYGLMGSGRTEIITSIFAGFPKMTWDGTLKIGGQEVKFNNPSEAIKSGIALVTEDRKLFGLVLGMSVGENISMASLEYVAKHGVIDEAADRNRQNKIIEQLRIKTPSPEQTVRNLSGGNQQKVVLGKWLAAGPRVLLMDEPTRGVDIGAKQEIYYLINELKAKGAAIVLVTSDLPELMGISDRIMIMHEGWSVGTFKRGEINAEQIGALASGNE